DLAYVFTDFFKCDLQPTAQGWLKFVNPAMFGPPEKYYCTDVTDYPGIIMNTYGKGTSVYFPWQVDQKYNTKGNFGHSRLIIVAHAACHDRHFAPRGINLPGEPKLGKTGA
ncbi:hypothetical protein ACFL6U_31705, partial [Planctomycetota bacterium]